MSVPNESMPPPAPEGSPSVEDRQWAMFAHLSLLAGGLISGWNGGWGFFVGPLIIWLIKKDTMAWASEQAKEALNFGILVSAIYIVLWTLTIMTLGIGFILTAPLMMLVCIAVLVLSIVGAVKTNEGIAYRYPVNIRIIK
jgi:uncharacterized Tic20 family protein